MPSAWLSWCVPPVRHNAWPVPPWSWSRICHTTRLSFQSWLVPDQVCPISPPKYLTKAVPSVLASAWSRLSHYSSPGPLYVYTRFFYTRFRYTRFTYTGDIYMCDIYTGYTYTCYIYTFLFLSLFIQNFCKLNLQIYALILNPLKYLLKHLNIFNYP